MKLLRDCFTGKDCKTWDVARILWASSVIVFLVLSIVNVCSGRPFDGQSYGIGLGGLLFGGGASIGAKAHAEPDDV